MSTAQVPVPVPGIVHFFGGIGTGIGKKLVPDRNFRYRLEFWVPSYSDDYQPSPGSSGGTFNWSKTHSTGPGGFYY